MGADSCLALADIANYPGLSADSDDGSDADGTGLECADDHYWNHTQSQCLCELGYKPDGIECRNATDNVNELCLFTNCTTCTATTTTCAAYNGSGPTAEDCFALNAVLETVSSNTGCACMNGFKRIYTALNEWRCERTADVARTDCAVASSAPLVKFTMTELNYEITS
jgi:hypothetical protein